MQEKAMMAAFETIVARGLVPRQELERWKTDPKFDARRGKFTITFRNANGSREIVIVVPATSESHSTHMQMSVEITAIVAGTKKTVPENRFGYVLFDKPAPKTVKVRQLLRRKKAA